MPEANEFTLHIFAALAQLEHKMISDRTKRALAEKKRKGVKLGSPKNLTLAHRWKEGETKAMQAREDIRNRQASKINPV